MAPFPAPGSVCPADGRALAPVASSSPAEVAEAVTRARAAQAAWGARTFGERAEAVRAIARRILELEPEATAILAEEMGRSTVAARLPEVAIVGDYVEGAIRAGRKALAPEKLKLSILDFPGKRGVIEMLPRGVVAIIAPWNYPLMQFYKPLFPALLAGNAVVLKPSEHAPRAGAFLARVCAEVLPEGLVQLVQGGGEVGRALLDQPVDAVTFTGSVATGRKVAALCGERLIPCSVELGGKDAAIVLADCDLDRTVAGLVYTSMFNAGQDCASVERIYVEDAVADRFVAAFAAALGRLRVAPAEHAEIGAVQNAAQLAIVEDHVADALAKGAKLLCGGARTGSGTGYQPTALDGCAEGMKVVDAETFGPVVAIVRVKDANEAVRRANASRYGLNGSVWTKDLSRGERIARQLEVGVAHVNGHAWTGGTLAEAPWTGVKDTGPGVAASRHAYSTFARPRTVMVDKNANPEPFWYPYDADYDAFTLALVERGKGRLSALFSLLGLLGKRTRTAKGLISGR